MYIALTSKNKLIAASSAIEVEDVFYCPVCKQQVILKNGTVIIPYFSHLPNMACVFYSENESQEHLAAKIEIHRQLQDKYSAQMEVVLPEINQRADVLFEDENKKTVVEIQFSPISIQRIKERTRGYESLGIKVIWLLGTTYSIKQLQLETVNKFIDERQSLYFWFSKKVTKISEITKPDFRKLQYKSIQLNLLDFLDGWQNKIPSNPQLSPKNLSSEKLKKEISKRLITGRLDPDLVTRSYIEFREPVSQLVFDLNLAHHVIMKKSGWEMQLELLIYLNHHQSFTYDDFKDHFNSNKFFYERGVDNSKMRSYVIDSFLDFLDKERWLVESDGKYFITSRITQIRDNK